MNVPRQTSTAAIVSLVFGVLSWFVLPLVGALVAIVAGHMARGDIRRSAGTIDGDGLAVGGLILGYANLLIGVFALLAVFLFFGGLAALAIFSQA